MQDANLALPDFVGKFVQRVAKDVQERVNRICQQNLKLETIFERREQERTIHN